LMSTFRASATCEPENPHRIQLRHDMERESWAAAFPEAIAAKQSQMNAAWLASLGRDHAQRVNSINAIYEERRATLTSMAFFSLDLRARLS